MAFQVIGDLRLQGPARAGPLVEEPVQPLDVHEQVPGVADLGRRPGKRAPGVDQVDGVVMRVALHATVAVLIGLLAVGARTLDKAVGQEGAGHRVVKLLDLVLAHQAVAPQGPPDLRAGSPILHAVRAAVVVELDLESGKIRQMRLLHAGDEVLLADAFLAGADHDRRAVRVVGADINTPLAAESLEADPDVGLDIFDQVAQMDGAVGVRQGAGDQDT